ncbi:MAG TPA: YraN family protein [Pseudomonadales bacterium]|nr:YraN family protein [Pseudomonadales bacterium]
MSDGPRTRAQQSGDAAERLAEQHLRRAGLITVARNWRCRLGELDLVMRDGAALVFVEVRRRRPGRHGTAAESVGPRKQARLIRAAQSYLQTLSAQPPCRFDVVAFDEDVDGELQMSWIRSAFEAG